MSTAIRAVVNHVLVATLLCLPFSLPLASDLRKVDLDEIPHSSWNKGKDEFRVLLFLTDDTDVVRKWDEHEAQTISSVEKVSIGTPVFAAIFFKDCIKKRKRCNITVSYSVVDERGESTLRKPPLEVWQRKAPREGQIELGMSSVAVGFLEDGGAGIFEVTATIRDRVSDTKYLLTREIEVLDHAAVVLAQPTTDYPLGGFWKVDSCADNYGLAISPLNDGLYSVSFCNESGCQEPGAYRPNSTLRHVS